MLGSPCSPCCGCTQQKADELNAALRAMTVQVTISQSSYVPQSGFFRNSNDASAIFACDWSYPPGTTPSLDVCRANLASSEPWLNTPGLLFAPEQQVSTSPYLLALDPSISVPAFQYLDDHIRIEFQCFYQPVGAFLGGSPVAYDESRCNFTWDLRVFKRRRSAFVSLTDVIDFPVQEITYGPASVAGVVGAAVARYRPYDYAVRNATQVDRLFPFKYAGNLSETYFKVVAIEDYPGYSENLHQLILNNPGSFFGTGSASKQQNGGLTITADSATRANNAWAFFDRTTEDTDVQPRLVENPSYSLTRLSTGQGDDRIRLQQTYSQISNKTVQQVGSAYTASAVVSLTP